MSSGQIAGTAALLRELKGFVHPYKSALIRSTVLLMVSVLLSLVPPLLFKRIVDEALPGKNLDLLLQLTGFIVCALAAGAAIQLMEQYFTGRFGLGMMMDIRNKLFHHLQRLPASFFMQRKQGEIISRFTTDLINVQATLSRTLPGIATNLLVVIASVGFMLSMSWKLTLVALVTLPVYFAAMVFIARTISRSTQKAMVKGEKMTTQIAENLSANGLIFGRVTGTQEYQADAFATVTREIRDIRVYMGMLIRSNGVLFSFMSMLGICLVYAFGGMLNITGEMTLGTVIAFSLFVSRLYQPFEFFASSAVDVSSSLVSLKRVLEYMSLEKDVIYQRETVADLNVARLPHARALTVQNLDFTYPGEGGRKFQLHNINIDVRKGEKVAVVGTNGSGKSTLAQLLAGVYASDNGSIYINNVNINELAPADLPKFVTTTFSNSFFFNDSIRHNLLMVRPDASEAELSQVLTDANCMEFVSRLKQGIDTVIGQDGLTLSSGQRQRLAIARMLLANSNVFVFDEVTSNLDPNSERLIFETIVGKINDKTSIFITHNFDLIRHANKVVVMDQGRVVNVGTLSQLSQSCPTFNALFGKELEQSQFDQQGVVLCAE